VQGTAYASTIERHDLRKRGTWAGEQTGRYAILQAEKRAACQRQASKQKSERAGIKTTLRAPINQAGFSQNAQRLLQKSSRDRPILSA